MSMTYKEAGVDVEKGDALIEKIKTHVRKTYGPEVKSGVGGFASLYQIGERMISAATDGVGTKLKLAHDLNRHNTIGQDLVAMCVNDLLCSGTTPKFFLDYFACGKLEISTTEQVIRGIAEACQICETALIGGETAEMPGMYPEGVYDLAGFAVGDASPKEVYDAQQLKEGTKLIGLPSSGPHSNGYSLIRQLFDGTEREWLEKLLTPTRLYVPLIKKIWSENRSLVSGLAHVTGGGFHNLTRLSKSLDVMISQAPSGDQLPETLQEIVARCQLTQEELYKTFNMGVGMVIYTNKAQELTSWLNQNKEAYFELGELTQGHGRLKLAF